MAGTLGRCLKRELPWIAAALQLLLLVLMIQVFRLEGAQFARVAWLLWGGFVVQHWLPASWRLLFFVALSVAALVLEAGTNAGWVLLFGAILIGICHLPLRVGIRSALLLVAGLVFAWLRIVPPTTLWQPQDLVWPILGGMFMFRLLAYVYDRHHDPALGSPQLAAAYFFMAPNATFPLYPPIDYRTFCGAYNSAGSLELYQSGLKWIGRGLVQLILYRAVLQYGYIEVEDVRSSSDVARHMLMTYLLYLRISGQFHVIVGILHLFGFNLPETHHRYLLASSFTDFWRRINIYWRDFLTRYFFYPVYFRIKAWGPMRSLTVATLVTFSVTWLLHSYQWFWLRGRFVLTWQDTVFWWALAGLVLFNALQEARRGRVRSLKPKRPTLRDNLILAARTIGVFVTISTLWTIWSCKSPRELFWLARRSVVVEPRDLLIVGCGLLAIGVAAVLWGRTAREQTATAPAGAGHDTLPAGYWASWRFELASLTVVLLVGWLPHIDAARGSDWALALRALSTDRPNAGDSERQVRGYYEELNQEGQAGAAAYGVSRHRSEWSSAMSKLRLLRRGPLGYELQPSRSMLVAGSRVTTNKEGMRDREYERQKPPGTCRLAVVGASTEAGWGVGDGLTYEHITEESLNRRAAAGTLQPFQRFELLNISVPGYGIHQKLLMITGRALEFDPDAILLVIYPEEFSRTSDQLVQLVERGERLPIERLQNVLDDAGMSQGLDAVALQAQAKHCRQQFVEAALHELADLQRQHGIPCFVVFHTCAVPAAVHRTNRDILFGFTASAGLPMLNLETAYDSVDDRVRLVLSPFDLHPNRAGHALLAATLEREIDRVLLPSLAARQEQSAEPITDAGREQ